LADGREIGHPRCHLSYEAREGLCHFPQVTYPVDTRNGYRLVCERMLTLHKVARWVTAQKKKNFLDKTTASGLILYKFLKWRYGSSRNYFQEDFLSQLWS